MGQTESRPWYRKAFERYYGELYGHRDGLEAEAAVSLIKRYVWLPGSLVLDVACGAGRHLSALEGEGAVPVGLDLSRALLREALDSGRRNLVMGDMRALPFGSGTFDGAVSMFTSFGYFPDAEEEMTVLREVARSLKAEGWFVLDYMNSILVRRTLEPNSRRKVGELDVVERRRIDPRGSTVIKRVEVLSGNRRLREHTEVVRLLSREDISRMLAGAGLKPLHFLGDYSGGSYEASSSPRLITFCEKGQP